MTNDFNITVEQTYSVRLDFEYRTKNSKYPLPYVDSFNDIIKRVEGMIIAVYQDMPDINIETFYGNAACEPYIYIKSDNKRNCVKVAKLFVKKFNKILRFKCNG